MHLSCRTAAIHEPCVNGKLKVLRDESGQTVVFMALFMGLVMLGFVGFALDMGYLFHAKRVAQGAADAAAIAAAEEYTYGNTSNVQSAANAAATMNGYNTALTTNPAQVTITYPTSGNYSNATSTTAPSIWVQAKVSEPVSTFFLGAFSQGTRTMTVTATSMACGGQGSPTCICLEGQTGQDLNMSNNAKISSTCGITVDSSSSNAIGVVGSASVCAQTLGTVSSNWDNSSNINNNGSICSTTKIVQGITSQCAPSMPAAPTYTSSLCTADPGSHYQGGATYTVGPGSNSAYTNTQNGNTACYNSLTVGANGDTVTINPGIYVISGGTLHFESGTTLGGNGVFFYLANGANVVIDNGANINLVAGGNTESGGSTAASTGAYNGILIYQPASDTQTVSVQGGSSAYINGSIFAPGAAITLGNGSGTNVQAGIVAQTLTMNGGGTLTNSSSTSFGTLNTGVAKVTQ